MSDRENIHKLQIAMSDIMDVVDTTFSVLIDKQDEDDGYGCYEEEDSDEMRLLKECKEVIKRTKENWYPVISEPLSEEE